MEWKIGQKLIHAEWGIGTFSVGYVSDQGQAFWERCGWRAVRGNLNSRITAKQRAAKFLRDVFPDEAGLVKAFREHARDAVARYKRSIGR